MNSCLMFAPAEASSFPSGLNATLVTMPVWPVRVWATVSVPTSHNARGR